MAATDGFTLTRADDTGLSAWQRAVVALHDRYQLEVVEDMNICPFARRSRETGKVARWMLWLSREAAHAELASAAVEALRSAGPDLEIALLTFVAPPGHALRHRAEFEALHHAFRSGMDDDATLPFYTAAFHPDPGAGRPDEERPRNTPDGLVMRIRCTPDPLIQCVHSGVLQRVRLEHQRHAKQRMRAQLEAEGAEPQLLKMLDQAIATDATLPNDLAEQNFRKWGQGDGRRQLDALLDELAAGRAELDRERPE